jgi:hypothetical protein
MSMVPVVDRDIGTQLVAANRWAFAHLPNAEPELGADAHYRLDEAEPVGAPGRPQPPSGAALAGLNRRVYRAYARRLRRKYPAAFGRGIQVGEGVAKLHPNDYGDLYDVIGADSR